MPKYEYACKSCGEHIEVVQSFKDDALTECPSCGGPLRKVFGNIGVVLKGSGFYRNDSRDASRSRPSGSSPKADGGADKASADGKSTKASESAKGGSDPVKSTGDSAKGAGSAGADAKSA